MSHFSDHLYVHVSMAQFEVAAQAAMDSIPEEFQPYLENTMFIIEESSPEGLLGLYEGATALGAGEGMPERITLYKRSHERAASSTAELVEEVRRTILHEVGHHFGMDEDDLPF
jgi:predicted Zn-dependent protease with MMP-like domain